MGSCKAKVVEAREVLESRTGICAHELAILKGLKLKLRSEQ